MMKDISQLQDSPNSDAEQQNYDNDKTVSYVS